MPVFHTLWTTYFERNLKELSVHPVANFVVAKALERHTLSASCETRWASFPIGRPLLRTACDVNQFVESLVGILRALIERAAALIVLEDEVCEICHPTLVQCFRLDKKPA